MALAAALMSAPLTANNTFPPPPPDPLVIACGITRPSPEEFRCQDGQVKFSFLLCGGDDPRCNGSEPGFPAGRTLGVGYGRGSLPNGDYSTPVHVDLIPNGTNVTGAAVVWPTPQCISDRGYKSMALYPSAQSVIIETAPLQRPFTDGHYTSRDGKPPFTYEPIFFEVLACVAYSHGQK